MKGTYSTRKVYCLGRGLCLLSPGGQFFLVASIDALPTHSLSVGPLLYPGFGLLGLGFLDDLLPDLERPSSSLLGHLGLPGHSGSGSLFAEFFAKGPLFNEGGLVLGLEFGVPFLPLLGGELLPLDVAQFEGEVILELALEAQKSARFLVEDGFHGVVKDIGALALGIAHFEVIKIRVLFTLKKMQI